MRIQRSSNDTQPGSAAADGTSASTYSGPGPVQALVQQPGHVFAAPGAAGPQPAGGVAGIGQITLSLCIVLAAIFAFAWAAKRMRGFGSASRPLDIIADVRLGPKERAVVLQVGGQQVLLGVAPGRVTALHVLAEPLPPTVASQGPRGSMPNFGELLRRSLGK